MDKKILAQIVDEMVKKVAASMNVDEGMARALVGFTLRTNSDALVNTITKPTLPERAA